MDPIIQFFDGLPQALVYALLGLGAALENVFPPIPADTFVLLGGFLASAGAGDPRWVFVATWTANVGSALIVYRLGHVYGRPFFEHGWGKRLLNSRQLSLLGDFYARWGLLAIFFTRFLPGFRAVVPVFAGVTHRRFLEVAPPLAIASGIWYGALVWLGAVTEQNLDIIVGWLSGVNRIMLAVALALGVLVAWAWHRTRRHHDERRRSKGGGGKT
jgi:membrane protein DedA with SNARE-associated domain